MTLFISLAHFMEMNKEGTKIMGNCKTGTGGDGNPTICPLENLLNCLCTIKTIPEYIDLSTWLSILMLIAKITWFNLQFITHIFALFFTLSERWKQWQWKVVIVLDDQFWHTFIFLFVYSRFKYLITKTVCKQFNLSTGNRFAYLPI